MNKPSFLEYLLNTTLLIVGFVLVAAVIIACLVGFVAVTIWACEFGVVGLIIECLVIMVLFIFVFSLYEYYKDLKKYKKTEE